MAQQKPRFNHDLSSLGIEWNKEVEEILSISWDAKNLPHEVELGYDFHDGVIDPIHCLWVAFQKLEHSIQDRIEKTGFDFQKYSGLIGLRGKKIPHSDNDVRSIPLHNSLIYGIQNYSKIFDRRNLDLLGLVYALFSASKAEQSFEKLLVDIKSYTHGILNMLEELIEQKGTSFIKPPLPPTKESASSSSDENQSTPNQIEYSGIAIINSLKGDLLGVAFLITRDYALTSGQITIKKDLELVFPGTDKSKRYVTKAKRIERDPIYNYTLLQLKSKAPPDLIPLELNVTPNGDLIGETFCLDSNITDLIAIISCRLDSNWATRVSSFPTRIRQIHLSGFSKSIVYPTGSPIMNEGKVIGIHEGKEFSTKHSHTIFLTPSTAILGDFRISGRILNQGWYTKKQVWITIAGGIPHESNKFTKLSQQMGSSLGKKDEVGIICRGEDTAATMVAKYYFETCIINGHIPYVINVMQNKGVEAAILNRAAGPDLGAYPFGSVDQTQLVILFQGIPNANAAIKHLKCPVMEVPTNLFT